MRQPSQFLEVGAPVTVKPRYLKRHGGSNGLQKKIDTTRPVCNIPGFITEQSTVGNQPSWVVQFDALPDKRFNLKPSCIKHAGTRKAFHSSQNQNRPITAIVEGQRSDDVSDMRESAEEAEDDDSGKINEGNKDREQV